MVRFGMLWNDPSEKKSVTQKLEEGVSAFIAKYKHQPTHASLPPAWYAMLTEEEMQKVCSKTGVFVENSQNVHLGSMFIGYPEVPEWWNR